MLPAILKSSKSLVTAGVAAALIAGTAAAPAMAWGRNEQNFVAGAASAMLLTAIIRPDLFQNNRRTYAQPVYVQPQQPAYYPQPGYGQGTVYHSPMAKAFNSYSRNERLRIQSTLAGSGYYHGAIDGNFGPGTYNAVLAFANNTGKSGMLASRAGAYTLYDGLLF